MFRTCWNKKTRFQNNAVSEMKRLSLSTYNIKERHTQCLSNHHHHNANEFEVREKKRK